MNGFQKNSSLLEPCCDFHQNCATEIRIHTEGNCYQPTPNSRVSQLENFEIPLFYSKNIGFLPGTILDQSDFECWFSQGNSA